MSTTEEEAIEYVAAVMQLYREQAAYLDRVWKWVEKTGLEKIRAAIMDDHEGRRALLAALREIAARGAQGPVGRARRRPRAARIHAARRADSRLPVAAE